MLRSHAVPRDVQNVLAEARAILRRYGFVAGQSVGGTEVWHLPACDRLCVHLDTASGRWRISVESGASSVAGAAITGAAAALETVPSLEHGLLSLCFAAAFGRKSAEK